MRKAVPLTLAISFLFAACGDQVVVRETQAACGNGSIEGSEQCDDGNVENTDSCTAGCIVAACGDGVMRNRHRRIYQRRKCHVLAY